MAIFMIRTSIIMPGFTSPWHFYADTFCSDLPQLARVLSKGPIACERIRYVVNRDDNSELEVVERIPIMLTTSAISIAELPAAGLHFVEYGDEAAR